MKLLEKVCVTDCKLKFTSIPFIFTAAKRKDFKIEDWEKIGSRGKVRKVKDQIAYREETDRKGQNADQDEDEEGEDISESISQGYPFGGLWGLHW